MNITKEQADRVTVLAVRIAVWLPGESETGRALKNDAAEIADIMRGLAEDAEPVARVAEVHMSRYTLEWLNGPLPEGTELYTSPQAAQTEAIDKREAALCEMVRLSENLGLYEKDFPKTEEQEREAFEAWPKACKEIIDRCVAPDMYPQARALLDLAVQAARAGSKP